MAARQRAHPPPASARSGSTPTRLSPTTSALDHLDLEGIEIVGEEWGVINVEAVAALNPT